MRINFVTWIFFFLTQVFFASRAEIVTLTTGAIAAGALGSFFSIYAYMKCNYFECCDNKWITTNIVEVLQNEVKSKLYGQHIAEEIVIRAVNAHVRKPNPNKALVISFHGWTGSGKNFLAKMIAKAIYKKEMHSEFVHLSVATLHFHHLDEVEEYKEQLRLWIKGNLTLCERSLFIFDEMDKMPLQLLDVILPFIDFYDHIGGIDPRKSIFLFLSNGGGNAIAQRTLSHYNEGRPREEITFKEMEAIIKDSAYNEGEGGLKMSRLIDRHMIDYFIPFLPLERKHVIMCFKDYLKRKLEGRAIDVTIDSIEKLADSLHYFPKSNPIYSLSGCKQVEQKADFLFADFIHNSNLDEI